MWHHMLMYMQQLYADAAEEALNLAEDDRPGALVAKVKWARWGSSRGANDNAHFDENIPLFKRAKESK